MCVCVWRSFFVADIKIAANMAKFCWRDFMSCLTHFHPIECYNKRKINDRQGEFQSPEECTWHSPVSSLEEQISHSKCIGFKNVERINQPFFKGNIINIA